MNFFIKRKFNAIKNPLLNNTYRMLEIITGEHNPILRQTSSKVTKFNKKLKSIIIDMKTTLIAANGLGLAGFYVCYMIYTRFPKFRDLGIWMSQRFRWW